MSEKELVVPGAAYRHHKGGRYLVLGVARNSEERKQLLVIYVSLDRGKIWVRPLNLPRIEGDDCWEDQIEWIDKVTRQRFVLESSLGEETAKGLEVRWAEEVDRARKAIEAARAEEDSRRREEGN